MARYFIITEAQARLIAENKDNRLIVDNEKYNMVISYLNKHYSFSNEVEFNANEDLEHVTKIYLIDAQGLPLVEKTPFDVLLKLDDKFHKIYNDDKKREIFLKHVINDWSKGRKTSSKNMLVVK